MARRVASEQGETLGESVGYQIRLEKVLPRYSDSILFCTTGVLLRMIQSNPLLSDTTHLILDEVHERDINSDFILMLLRDSLSLRPNLRIILMSATLDAKLFAKYFYGAPIIQVRHIIHLRLTSNRFSHRLKDSLTLSANSTLMIS